MDTDQITIPRTLISKTESFDANTPISRIISSIDAHGAVIVNKNEKYYGIIDNESLYKYGSTIRLGNKKSAGKFVTKTPIITDSTPVDDVLLNFYNTRAKALPYSSGKTVNGVLKRFTMLKILLSLKMLNDIKVSEAMTTPVLAIDSSSNLSHAKAIMRERNINRLVILQNDKLYGIITNHDLMHKYAQRLERLPEMKDSKYNPLNIPISSIAASNPVVIDQGKSVAEAAREMVERNISSIIVTKGRNPVGIITVLDIFNSILLRRHIEKHKIFISGLSAELQEYQGEVADELTAFMRKVEAVKKAHPLYVTVNIKKIKGNEYEMHARMAVENFGTVNAAAEDYTIEKTLRQLIERLTKDVIKSKEKYIKIRNRTEFREGMEESAGYEE
jgi:signal-transduction protein with cAMP-binding, CBS, and nucleotidyltransferase domain